MAEENYSFFYKNRQLIWAGIMGLVSLILVKFTPLIGILPFKLDHATTYILCWNLALAVYLGMVFYMMLTTDVDKMKKRSKSDYEKKRVMLILTVLASLTSISAIVSEMGAGGKANGAMGMFHLGLAILTIVQAWLFIHTMFALYYAHFFYHDSHDSDHPLDFPHESNPDYFDFIYFAFGIGATGQSSDVNFTNKILRRMGTVHSVLAFFFNTAILALLIEMAGNFFSG